MGTLNALLLAAKGPRVQGADFTYLWLGARAVLHGLDPYAYVAHAATPWESVLFYPLPATFLAIPFAWIPVRLAASLFVAIECGLLAYVVSRRSWWRLALFASAPIYQAVWASQTSPLFLAIAVCAPALGLVVCKPNLGLPFLAFQRTWRAIGYAAVGGALLLIISLLVQPHWPAAWLATLRSHPLASQYQSPIATPFGFLLLLAALKWRRPEARLLLGMACIPQNMFFYEQLPLLLIPSTRRELLVACSFSVLAYMMPGLITFSATGIAERSAQFTPLVMIGLYLPALVMVLRRPNLTDDPKPVSRQLSVADRSTVPSTH